MTSATAQDPSETSPHNTYVVRYSSMRHLGEFTSRNNLAFRRNDDVIIKSERGVEFGTVLCSATDDTAAYFGEGLKTGRILRIASDEDRRSREESIAKEASIYSTGCSMIEQGRLQMQVVDIELIFGGERIVFYYLAEKRVDFRELVKAMAREFGTRIEMRQIGVRDEARLLADYGDCGKPVCCNTHLSEMPPVSIKMAKLQKASLDPNKISGRCGRLKCCLRYEYDTYEEARKELPAVGSTVVTKDGQARVIAQELLIRKLLVIFDGGRRVMISDSDVVNVVSRGNHDKKSKPAGDPK